MLDFMIIYEILGTIKYYMYVCHVVTYRTLLFINLHISIDIICNEIFKLWKIIFVNRVFKFMKYLCVCLFFLLWLDLWQIYENFPK